MKRALLLALTSAVCLCLFPTPAFAVEEELPAVFDIDTSPFEEYFDGVSEYFEEESFSDFFSKMLSGEYSGKKLLSVFLEGLLSNSLGLLPKYAVALGIALLFGVLSVSADGFFGSDVRGIMKTAMTVTLSGYLAYLLTDLLVLAKGTVESAKSVMFLSFPAVFTCLFALGGGTSTATLQPLCYFLSVVFTGMITDVVYPLLTFSFACKLLSRISNGKFDKASDLSRTVSVYLLRGVLVIFSAVLGVSGVFGAKKDGVMYVAAKYALSGSVPIVGSFVKDGIDMMFVTGASIKNTFGITALILFAVITLSPLLNCYLSALFMRATGAIASAFSDEKVGGLFDGMAQDFEAVGGTIVAVTVMFSECILAITLATGYIV